MYALGTCGAICANLSEMLRFFCRSMNMQHESSDEAVNGLNLDSCTLDKGGKLSWERYLHKNKFQNIEQYQAVV